MSLRDVARRLALCPSIGPGFSMAKPEETQTKLLDVNPWVFWGANAIIGSMVLAAAIATQDVGRGRTIREFLLGVMLAPTLVAFIWFTVFGDTALHIELFGEGGIGAAVTRSVPTAIFAMLERLPLSSVSSILCIICVILFFVTSSDSASLVVDTIASGGKTSRIALYRELRSTDSSTS